MTGENPIDKLLFQFDRHADVRGQLTLAHVSGDSHLPFCVQRVFWITNVPGGMGRGKHAHQTCWEALAAVSGSFQVKIDDGRGHTAEVKLDTPHKGLLIPPMYWCELTCFSKDAVCLCLASGDYDQEGYISEYGEFVRRAHRI